MTSAADETTSGTEMEEIQLEVVDDIMSGTGAQSLPAAAQGDEPMSQLSECESFKGSPTDGSFQVEPSEGSFQVAPTEGSFQVVDRPQDKTLLYRGGRMVVVEGGTPAAAQKATTQSQQSAAQIPAVEAVDSEPAGGGSGGEKEAAQTATPGPMHQWRSHLSLRGWLHLRLQVERKGRLRRRLLRRMHQLRGSLSLRG